MKPATFLQFCLLTLATGCAGLGYQDYSCAGSAGDTPDATHTEGPDQNLGNNYVAEHPKYTIGCCAVITQWNVKAGKEGTIQLQIWRRLSNTNYLMIGENYCIITSRICLHNSKRCGEEQDCNKFAVLIQCHDSTGCDEMGTDIGNVKQCPIDVQDQMVVQKGDFMGWHSNGEELLMYKDAHYQDNTLSSMFRRMKPTSSSGTGDLHPGQLYNWQDANVYNDRDYAIEVIYVTSTPPVVTPILASVQIPDYNISSATITRITYSDPDVADNNTLSKFALQSVPFFSLDLNSGFVMGDSSYPFRARDSQIGLSVYDTCYNSASATVNFDVTANEKDSNFGKCIYKHCGNSVNPDQLASKKPADLDLHYFQTGYLRVQHIKNEVQELCYLKLTFESLPASFTLPKNGTSQSLIHRITWTDTANDPVYCRYLGTDPFLLQPLSTTEYGLYVSEYAFTSLTAPSMYTLSITCTETRVVTTTTEASTGTVTIYVTDNLAPSITNLDASATVDAETAKAGDIVYTVSSSDPESDVVTYSATCTPNADCPLEIRQTGEIQINRGLLFSQSHSYTLEITITDSYNNPDGPNFFLLTIQNINNDASFTNLPLSTTLEVMENTPVDTPLYTILYHDRDIADTKIMTVTYDDPRLSRLFNLDPSTGVLSTAFNVIDYEAFSHPTTYVLTVALGDTKSDITETINLEFVNQNEPPRFTKDYFDITIEEGDIITTPNQSNKSFAALLKLTTHKAHISIPGSNNANDQVALRNEILHDIAQDGFLLTDGQMFTTNVYDEDTLEALNMETHTYSLDCENGTQTQRFYLDPTTASLVFAGPFDLDTTGTPNEVSCDITVTDKYGLTGTADIHIHVTNKNDFSPEFSKTSYTIYVQPDTLIGTSVLTVSADDLDADLDNDKEFYYTLNQSALGTEYFHVDQNGRVFLVASFSLGQSHNPFIVVVNNPSDPVKSGTATIQAVIPSSTTTAAGTTTDRNIGFYEDLYNTIWLLLVLGGIIIIVLTISLVMFQIMNLQIIPVWCRICCINCKQRCCKPKPDPERGFGDRGYDLTSFGHEHKYTDDDDIDGWIRRQGPKDTKQPQGGYHRFGVSQDNSKQVVRKDPIYEMFRVPTPTNQDRLDRTGPKITWKRGQRF